MTEREPTLQTDPIIEASKKDADRSLIRENLQLSVERFEKLMELQRFAEELRRATRSFDPQNDEIR